MKGTAAGIAYEQALAPCASSGAGRAGLQPPGPSDLDALAKCENRLKATPALDPLAVGLSPTSVCAGHQRRAADRKRFGPRRGGSVAATQRRPPFQPVRELMRRVTGGCAGGPPDGEGTNP